MMPVSALWLRLRKGSFPKLRRQPHVSAAKAICYAAVSLACCAAGADAAEPSPELERLVYAHVVIECTVADFHRRAATLEQLNIPSTANSQPVGITVVDLADVKTLRGYGSPTQVRVSPLLESHLVKGQRVVMCCYWMPTLQMFTVPADRSFFRLDGSEWVGLPRAIGAQPTSISTDGLDALIKKSSLPAITADADLVVVGSVAAASDTVIEFQSRTYRVERITLKTNKRIKGDGNSSLVTFVVARGYERPAWFTVTPGTFNVGEKWIAFLHQDGDLLYPVGGVNGLLQFSGEDVIFDRAVKCPFSPDKLASRVEEVMSETH